MRLRAESDNTEFALELDDEKPVIYSYGTFEDLCYAELMTNNDAEV